MVQVIYSVKNEDGFVVEKKIKFHTTKSAYSFIVMLRRNVKLVGKPIMEAK